MGSQSKSFIFNISLREHASCGTPARPPASIANYPSLLKFTHLCALGSPQNPPSELDQMVGLPSRSIAMVSNAVTIRPGTLQEELTRYVQAKREGKGPRFKKKEPVA